MTQLAFSAMRKVGECESTLIKGGLTIDHHVVCFCSDLSLLSLILSLYVSFSFLFSLLSYSHLFFLLLIFSLLFYSPPPSVHSPFNLYISPLIPGCTFLQSSSQMCALLACLYCRPHVPTMYICVWLGLITVGVEHEGLVPVKAEAEGGWKWGRDGLGCEGGGWESGMGWVGMWGAVGFGGGGMGWTARMLK